MIIGLDYDGTYSADPVLFAAFIELAKQRGHEVICITMRHPHEPIEMSCEVIYTARAAKLPFMHGIGRAPHIWIDDNPIWLFESSI